MQADNNKRKLPTSAEIVDLPPPASTSTSSEISFKPEDVRKTSPKQKM
jgi:hypothetical protein